MIKKILVILNILFCLNVFAYEKQFVITSILTDENINVQRLDKNISVKFGDLLAIYSHETNTVLGYAKVLSVADESDLIVARVETHDKNGLIRIENYLKKIDLQSAKTDIPARFDLTIKTDQSVAAKYRPLVYTGLVNGMTASNLIKGEVLAGPSILGYGLNSSFQVSTNLISSMFKIMNGSIKTKLYDQEDITFSIENTFQYFTVKRRGSYSFSAYLDTTSNSSFKSYGKMKVFTTKPEDQYLYNSDEYAKDLNVELQLSYGYMLSNWRQIIVGPKVDVNKRRVGGSIGYYVVDKNVNMMFGVSSNDFSEFVLGKQGYLLNFDLWWRF
jgi:hypothetical protein